MPGYAEDEISNAFPEWESRVHPDDRERASRAIRDYLENRSEEYELEHRLRHKDGSYRWILSRGAAVRDGAERASRMVGSHIDITAQKHTAEQLNEKLVQLRAARKIQQTLLPKRSPDLAGLDIAGFSEPAAYAGGDMYDYLTMVGGHLGVVVGDVSGHGIGAALQMASTSAFLRSLAQTCATIGEIMTRVNVFVYEGTDEEFVTLVLARIDLRSRTLTYANAGHPTGYILDAAGVVRAELGSSTIPLGIEGHLDFPVGAPIVLRAGDLIVLVTDGILEAESPEGKPFGEARMLEVIRSARDGSSREILETLRLTVGHHSRIESPRDDLTAVVIKLSDQST
jgi:sigma-B regulation protein RsbU (phosphoserine phosphatase)